MNNHNNENFEESIVYKFIRPFTFTFIFKPEARAEIQAHMPSNYI